MDLFTLSKNYNHAMLILVHHLSSAYLVHAPGREAIAQRTEDYFQFLNTLDETDVTPATLNSAMLLIQMVHIIYQVDLGQMDVALTEIEAISVLPHSKSSVEIQRACRQCEGVEASVVDLIPELILKTCTCLMFFFSQLKSQFVGM